MLLIQLLVFSLLLLFQRNFICLEDDFMTRWRATDVDYSYSVMRYEINNYNNSKLKASMHIEKYNRTQRHFIFDLTIKSLIENLRIRVTASRKNIYNMYNNKIASFEFSFCTAIRTNLFGFGVYIDGNVGNLTLCPISPGKYFVSNKAHETKFPPNIPLGEYRVDQLFIEEKKPQLKISEYSKLDKVYRYKGMAGQN